MKGIVLETNDKKAAVLFDNGSVSKIKNNQYEIGQVINMNNKFNFMAKAGSIAAALVITTATGYAYTTPSTYVSLDVNPSIEYKLNAFDRVISVVAVNEDGEKIVNDLDVNNEKIQKAILKTVEKLKAEGILTDEDYSGIVIAVSNKSEEKSEKLSDEIKKELNEDDNDEEDSVDDETDVNEDEDKNVNEVEEDEDEENSDIEISVEAVGRERVEEARKLNVTPGKLNLVQKLIASTDEFDDIDEEQLNELLNLSVKEINKMTQAFKKGLDVEFAFDADVSDDLDDEDAEDTDKEEVNEDNDVKDVKDVKDKGNNNKDKNKAVKERSEEVNDDDSDEIDDEDINDDEDNSKDINKPVKEEKENIEKSNNGKAAGKEKNN
ncbi:MAG: hypothetical protein K0R07_202 [Sedimentibacter sp.]|nr:hypothetical protein [Sedimentibacter sp.]